MDINQTIQMDQQYYMNCFGNRIPVCFTHGEGVCLYDQNEKRYTDFLAGIATNALGYSDVDFTNAICAQAKKLLHTSNYFYIQQQAELAKALCQNSCADKAFIASTGAEANECAFKLARKYFRAKGQDRFEIISALNSFHGRTLATLAATGQEQYRKDYTPVPAGFINVEFNDLSAIKKRITDQTAAIIIELIQGEGGIISAEKSYVKALRDLCDEQGILLIFDEVQTGMGRTGNLFAYQQYDIEPDIFTLAKALGNGIPISACLCKKEVAAFSPADHGTTFGGNPFCCTAALEVIKRLTSPGFLDHVAKIGDYFKNQLIELKHQHPQMIVDVRGQGLLLGIELDSKWNNNEVKTQLLHQGFVVGTAGQNTLRFVPPLIIEKKHIDTLIQALSNQLNIV